MLPIDLSWKNDQFEYKYQLNWHIFHYFFFCSTKNYKIISPNSCAIFRKLHTILIRILFRIRIRAKNIKIRDFLEKYKNVWYMSDRSKGGGDPTVITYVWSFVILTVTTPLPSHAHPLPSPSQAGRQLSWPPLDIWK